VRSASLVLLIAGTVGCATSSHPANDVGWNYELATLYWAVGLEGDVAVGDGGGSSSASLDDPLGFEKGAILHGEMERDSWSLIADGLYVDYAGSTGNLGPLTTQVGIEAAIVKLAVERTVASWSASSTTGRIDLSAYAGARYVHLEVELDVQASGRRAAREDWVDPFVGLRVQIPMGQHFGLELSGDVGGFGVGSDLVWDLSTRIDWNPYPGFGVFVGYKILEYDFDEGSSDTIRYDVRLSGPLLGLAWRF